MFVYKVSDEINGYYLYVVSRVKNIEIFEEQLEHYAANEPDDIDIAYFNFIGWNTIKIEVVSDIKPIDVLNKNLPNDGKCMNVTDSFKSLIVIPEKKKRVTKQKTEKPKKEPKKPKIKPSCVSIDQESSSRTLVI